MSEKTNPQPIIPGLPGQAVPGLPGQNGSAKLDSHAPTEVRLPKALTDARDKGIPFGRLVSVEMRKMVDTRAGKVLLGVTLLLVILICAAVGWNTRKSPEYYNMLGGVLIPFSFILPILGILTVTSEWSQRTGLITFTLQPRRLAIAAAKWVAAMVVTIAVIIASFALAALFIWGASMIGGSDVKWSLPGNGWWTIPLMMLLYTTMGVAFGMLIQNTPGAICAYLFMPMVVSLLSLLDWARKAVAWVDIQQTMAPLQMGEVHSDDWKKLGVSLLIWLVLPLALGLVRLVKREVKSA